MKFLLTLWVFVSPIAWADGPGRIYTKPVAEDTGVISGKVSGAVLTHAIAVERDRLRVYLAMLVDGNAGFRFEKLPVGRFDLVLVTKDSRVIEGLELGEIPKLADAQMKHLEASVAKADSFFNRHQIHRIGLGEESALVFVERIRDLTILRGSGEKLEACLRRLEIIDLQKAGDDWQMIGTRHLFREETPPVKAIPFLSYTHLPALCGLRLAGAEKNLGTIDLTPINTP